MFWSPLQQQAFEEMNSYSRLISQYKLLLDIWPGAGFDGHSTVERAWPALQERVLEPPVLAGWWSWTNHFFPLGLRHQF